jgi:hypothetical protein
VTTDPLISPLIFGGAGWEVEADFAFFGIEGEVGVIAEAEVGVEYKLFAGNGAGSVRDGEQVLPNFVEKVAARSGSRAGGQTGLGIGGNQLGGDGSCSGEAQRSMWTAPEVNVDSAGG